jgi:DeoR family glycerol-3-phosphate regulon repressor
MPQPLMPPPMMKVSRAILGQARAAVLVADATKLTRAAPVRIAGLADLDHWITDAEPGPRLRALAEASGTRITIAA